jgi:hypothetical protein
MEAGLVNIDKSVPLKKVKTFGQKKRELATIKLD